MANGLVPNFVGALSGGFGAGTQFRNVFEQRKQQRKQQQIADVLSGAVVPFVPEQSEQQRMLAEQTAGLAGVSPQAEAEQPAPKMSFEQLKAQAQRIDPAIAEQTLKTLGLDDASKRAEASRFAAHTQSLPPSMQDEAIIQRAETLRAQGRNPQDTLQLLDMNPTERAQALQGVQMLDLSTKERFAAQQEIARAEAAVPKANQVKSSDILPDGTTIQVMGDGSTRVTNPAGEALQGQARSDAIRDAQEFGVDIQQRRSQARGIGKFTSKMAEGVYEKIDKMRVNNDNLRQLITEVKGGAKSGPLINKLPTLTAATLRLNNIKNRLGLDVVGSVTFGALSAKELELAQQTAVPDLPEAELIKWAEDKLIANEKLSSYLEQQAAFLSQPGNTRADWDALVRKKREQQQPTGQPAQQPAPAGVAQKIGRFDVRVK